MRFHLPALNHGVMDPAPALYVIRINGHLGATVLSAFPAMASRLLRSNAATSRPTCAAYPRRYRVEGHGPSPGCCGQTGWPGGLEADLLADEDDVDAAGQFLVDLEDLPDLAVLPVGGLRAGVFQRQAVLIDPLVRRCQRGHELLRADDEDDIGGAPGVGGELAA